ncbi:hypothetical protein CcaverHIS641_0306490 [Cutaneotrichosporon cavernicola]|nr:hypothetical protein CcaverHIS641_0306490 [Cutaneotrichosporon cavernicola]
MAPISFNEGGLFARANWSSPEHWTPNPTQRVTLIVAGCYILWHVPVLCELIYPFKLLTVGLHEMSHALAGVLTCARIESIQGFDINASKVACLVLAPLLLITLWWARRSWVAYATFLFTGILIAVAWVVYHSVGLRFLWDIIDDTLKRKIAASDASQFAKVVHFGNSYVWVFGAGLLLGIAAFKTSWDDQMAAADRFLGGESNSNELTSGSPW